MTYCTDNDLLIYRSNILSLGVDSWETQREEAYKIINRMITVRWYNKIAPEMGIDPTLTEFDPAKVLSDQLKRLECYKTLEFAYMLLMKDSPEADGFERNMLLFSKLFNSEFNSIINLGLDYDWDNSGSISVGEKNITAPRRLMRA